MAIRCEVCHINKAYVKDYRMAEDSGNYNKYLVCLNCFMLNNEWFFKLKYAKEGISKKKIILQITEGNWKDYFIEDINYE